ncbi:MAG: amidase family protein [Albidovulum sp.]|nr:amidase family protein [Albidovulum sp.]
MGQELLYLSAIEMRDQIIAKEISPVEVLEHSLERREEVDPALNCFVTTTDDMALEAAKAAERAIMDGDEPGLLHGIPISIKDLIAVGGVRQTFGSNAMAENIAAVDAPSVEQAKRHGALVIGKSTTSEFGCKPVGDSPVSGITRNPWNLAKTPGGSSCGAVASVASGITPFALGTDGGGSVRIPCSLTGLFGIKANFGRVPVFPVSATPTLAHVGAIARTVRDSALLLSAVSEFDSRDPFSVAGPVPDFLAACDRPVDGMKIAWSPTLGYASPLPEVLEICEQAVKAFEELGCNVDQVDRVMDCDPSGMWMAEFYAGVGTRLKGVLANAPDQLDPAVVEVLDGALDQTLDEYYSQVFLRYEFREKIRSFMQSYDLLVSPTLPVPAFDVGLNVPPQLKNANIISWVCYTYPFNLTGNPSASLPVGFTEDGLPVGLQLVSNAIREEDIFRACAASEAACPRADKKPPLA